MNDSNSNFNSIEDSIKNTYMRIVWSHKIHEKQADILSSRFKRYEVIGIICSSLTAAGIVSLIFYDPFLIKLATATISFISILINLFLKSFDWHNKIKSHKITAQKLLFIRDKLEMLLLKSKIRNNNLKDLLKNYEDLQTELHKIYSNAPNTTDKAVKLAKTSLSVNKDNEFTDEEINSNLPKNLQRK